MNWNFPNEFPETFCSIRFWTGISGNFGRMELAPHCLPPTQSHSPCTSNFGRTLQTATKVQVFASVRNSHITLQLAVAKHSFLSKCWFTIFREHNNSFHLITLFTRCKHRHQYYIGVVQIFEPLRLFSKSMKLPDASRIPRVPHHLTCG